MQFTTLSVAFFAALATAHQHAQHFHNRRQLNSSSADSGAQTTLTVIAEVTHTITSCAASITNCPAGHPQATSEIIVTDTITVDTTICPVTAAESASSAILASYTSNVLTSTSPSGSLGTGVASYNGSAPSSTNTEAGAATSSSGPLVTGVSSALGAVSTGGSSPSGSVVLTYTLGQGTSTTVVTTTVQRTQTATVYATLKPGSSGPSGAEIPTSGSAGAYGNQAAASTDITTTLSSTSTSTVYITVLPVTSGSSGTSALGAAVGNAGGSAACVPITVTVTTALGTVTVTETATPAVASANSGAVASAAGSPGSENQAAASSSGPVVILSTATVIPLPVSTGATYSNGTASTTMTTKCSSVFPSSGFISSAYSTGTAPISSATGGWKY